MQWLDIFLINCQDIVNIWEKSPKETSVMIYNELLRFAICRSRYRNLEHISLLVPNQEGKEDTGPITPCNSLGDLNWMQLLSHMEGWGWEWWSSLELQFLLLGFWWNILKRKKSIGKIFFSPHFKIFLPLRILFCNFKYLIWFFLYWSKQK